MALILSISGVEPVTVAEAKFAARIDNDVLDDLVGSLITGAREQAEHVTSRCYRPQVRRYELVQWPTVCEALPIYAATECAVSYWTGVDWSAPLDVAAYTFASGGLGGAGTVLAPATTWPELGVRAVGPRVRIDVTAGPESPGLVPEQVKTFIKASVGAWLKTPEAQREGRGITLTPNPLFERLLDAERLFT